ncbi:phosphoethanolamine transferase, partial [Rodentibacter caecimuris]
SGVSYYSIFFNIYFDSSMLTNILQTTITESSKLITPSYILWVVVFGIIPAVLYFLVKISYNKWYKEITGRFIIIILSVLVVSAIGKGFYQDYASFLRNNKSITHLLVPSNFIGASIKKIKKIYQENIPYSEQDLMASQSKFDSYRHVTVLIVGETTRAQNWGLNGYLRQTTPLLAQRGKQIINFTDVSSCGTSTAYSVPCMFSTMDRKDYDEAKANLQDNLLDILQRAGVNIFWLDNDSGCKGVCDRVPNLDVTQLNLPEYCQNGECLDNILLTKFDDILNKSDNKDILIVLHTIGSHGPTYSERYSPEFRQFIPTCDINEINKCTNEELVNTYDNGILYIDQFIDKVIKKLETKNDWESTVLYMSDHGESLGENGVYLHSAPYAIAPKEQTKIPMIMWFSEAFRRNEGIDFSCLDKNAKRKSYSHDNFFSTVFGLMDMSLKSDTYKQEKDILAPCKNK